MKKSTVSDEEIHLIPMIFGKNHFHTENPVCAVVAEKLQAAFPEITVILSKNHSDCMKFY